MKRVIVAGLFALAAGAGAFLWQAQAQPRGGGIESSPLLQLDGWGVGALSRAQGALPQSLWAQSNPAIVASLFDRLPATFESPAAATLARRALLSAGQAPPGDGGVEAMRKRFSALGRLGLATELATMAAGAGADGTDPAVAQYAAQAELARGRRADACARGRLSAGEEPSTFLLRLRAYCAAAGGERAAADLALEVSRGGADDAWFRSAVSGMGDGAARPTVIARYDTSLNAAVSVAAHLRPPATNPLSNASSLALAAIARSEGAEPALRAQAATLAYRRGALTASEARDVFHAIPATVTTGLPSLVTALRAIEADPPSLAAATAAAGVLRQATALGDFASASRFLSTDIATLAAAPDSAAALSFARAALFAEDVSLAERLLKSAEQAGAESVGLARTGAALSVAKGETGAAIADRRIENAGTNGARAAARDAAILAALGKELSPPARAFLIANPTQGGAGVDAGLMAALTGAAGQQAQGETALLAAIALAPGAHTIETNALCAIIRALKTAGLEEDAERVAVEAILGGAPA